MNQFLSTQGKPIHATNIYKNYLNEQFLILRLYNRFILDNLTLRMEVKKFKNIKISTMGGLVWNRAIIFIAGVFMV